MKILVDIGHPAHVHYYRNLAIDLLSHGHKVFWSVKEIPVVKFLLSYYGFSFISLPKKSDEISGKIFKQFLYDVILLRFCLKNNIDIAIGTSVSVAHISRLIKINSVVFDDDDDDVQPLVTKYVNPFADSLLSPDVLKGKRRRKDTIYYPGYHELAYLHPKRFKPDKQVLSELGIDPAEPYFIMRFNAFKAHHDVGVRGFSLEQKLKLIEMLKPFGKIYITTERDIEPELKPFQLIISPEKIHSLLAFSHLFIGDSQTMTSEAAVLGIPSLRCNTLAGRISYLEEEEKKYSLTFAFTPEEFPNLLVKLQELLSFKNLKEEWQKRRQKMLEDKIDVTAFWVWFVENYPESTNQIIDSPVFWNQFK